MEVLHKGGVAHFFTCLHPFHAAVFQCLADPWVLLHHVVMPIRQVVVGNLWVPGDQVAAISKLVVGMTKQCRIACSNREKQSAGVKLLLNVLGELYAGERTVTW